MAAETPAQGTVREKVRRPPPVIPRRARKLLLNFVVIGVGILICVPFIWVLLSSFKPKGEVMSMTRPWWPSHFTLDNYRDYYWYPAMFERRMLGSWQQDGSKTIEEKARVIAREKIASVDPRVDDATAKKMDALYKKAAGNLS